MAEESKPEEMVTPGNRVPSTLAAITFAGCSCKALRKPGEVQITPVSPSLRIKP